MSSKDEDGTANLAKRANNLYSIIKQVFLENMQIQCAPVISIKIGACAIAFGHLPKEENKFGVTH